MANTSMNRDKKLAELKSLQAKADAIREQLGISSPGEVLFLAHRNTTDDDLVVLQVKFDGIPICHAIPE